MSESSEDKTVRKFTKHLQRDVWCYQISIFYKHYSDHSRALLDRKAIVDVIRKGFPRQPFLYRLCLIEAEPEVFDDIKNDCRFGQKLTMAFHTLFTDRIVEIKELEEKLTQKLKTPIRCKRRKFDDLKKYRYLESLNKGEPHNLKQFFNSDARRWSIIGRKNLPES